MKQVQPRKANVIWSHLYEKSKRKTKTRLLDPKNRVMVQREGDWGLGKMGEGGQKLHVSSYKINKPGDAVYGIMGIVNNTISCI